MNLEALKESLRLHEGVVETAYEDSLGFLTIGVGHLLSRPISKAAINQILDDDIAIAVAELDRVFPSWRSHSEVRQNVLAEMAFQLGIPRLSGFVKMWNALRAKDYQKAADEMTDSEWYRQTPNRAQTLADRMRQG